MPIERVQQEIADGSLDVSERATALVVETATDYASGVALLQGVRSLRDRIDSEYGPVVRSAYAAHKSAVSLRKSLDGTLEQAERCLKGKLSEWAMQRENQVAATQQEREAQIQAIAEQARQSVADELRANGNGADAAALLAEPLALPPVPKERAVPDIGGVIHKTTWTAEVLDRDAFFRACLEEPRWMQLWQVDVKALNKMARSLKDNLTIPGVVVRKHSGITLQGRKDRNGKPE